MARVNRRIGGLENISEDSLEKMTVNRRIGGLEIKMAFLSILFCVNRRIGGLEKNQMAYIDLMTNNIGCVIIKPYSL